MKKDLNTKRFFNMLAFIALVISGVALLISKIFFGDSATASFLNGVAYVLAFVVTSVSAFYYVRSTRNITILIVYIVAVIIVVVPLVLSMFRI